MSAHEHLLDLLDRADELVEQQRHGTVDEVSARYRELREIQRQAVGDPIAWGIVVKSIDSAVSVYRKSLRAITGSFFRGDVSRADFARAIADDLQVDSETVFIAGLEEGGASSDEMSDEEQKYLDAWVKNQLTFVDGVAEAAAEAKGDRALQRAFYGRIDLWVDSMRTLGMTAKGFASADQMGQWKFGQTEKHCSTCSKLANGPPHRVSWFLKRGYIPRENGSETLQCKGFRCDCQIDSVKTGERLL